MLMLQMMQFFKNYDDGSVRKVRRRIGEGMMLMVFAIELCLEQLRGGRHFVVEHPVGVRVRL